MKQIKFKLANHNRSMLVNATDITSVKESDANVAEVTLEGRTESLLVIGKADDISKDVDKLKKAPVKSEKEQKAGQ